MLGTPSDCLEFLYRVLNLIKERFVSAFQSITKPRKSMKKSRLPARFIVAMIKFTCFHLFLAILTLGVSWAGNSYSQETLARTVTLQIENQDLRSALATIERNARVKFSYDLAIIPEGKVNLRARGESLAEVLEKLLTPLRISYSVSGKYIVLSRRQEEEINGSVNNSSVNLFQAPPINEIRGTVTDENGQGLPGVSILIKGTQRGMITDTDGRFTIDVPNGNAVLVFSYVGYQTQEIEVGNNTTLNVILEVDEKSLEEVVVVGYGVQKKANLTGAVDQVSGDNLHNRPIANVSRALQGLIPNLNISNSGGSPNAGAGLNIRGTTSINGGGPLVLVDNVQMDINLLNPEDIESITVLKDAASAAIYGARGAFGVILITLKKGVQDRKPVISYTGGTEFNTSTYLPDMLSSWEYMNVTNLARQRRYGSVIYSDQQLEWAKAHFDDPENNPSFHTQPNGSIFWHANVNNFEEMLQTWSPAQNHSVSVNGGGRNVTYFVSLGSRRQEGMFRTATDVLKRYNLLVNLTSQVNERLKVGVKASYTNKKYDEPHRYAGKGSSWWEQMTRGVPQILFPIRTPHDAPIPDAPTEHFYNFLNSGSRNISNTEVGLYALNAELDIVKGLKLKGDFNYQSTNDMIKDVQKEFGFIRDRWEYQYNQTTPSYVHRQARKTNYFAFNSYLTYDETFGKNHTVSALLGFNQEWSNSTVFNVQGNNLISNNVPVLRLVTGEIITGDGETDWAIRGLFTRLNYSFKDKYLFEMNGRYDGTSRFPHDKRFKFFPSFSAGWRLNEEAFMDWAKPTVSELKLRASYGDLGNQNLANAYPFISNFSVINQVTYLTADGLPLGLTPPGLVSPDLTWERASTIDAGIDVSLWNRLHINYDWYRRTTSDMLVAGEKLPAVLGVDPPSRNAAELQTTGWEFSINYSGQTSKDLNYGVRFILSDYTSVITKYDNNPNKLITTYYEGQKFGEIWGYETAGIFRSQDEIANAANHSQIAGVTRQPGDIQYKDLNNDGVINWGNNTVDNPGDQRIIGNSTPRFQYGFSGNLNWKNIDFRVFFQGLAKRDVFPTGNFYWGQINAAGAVGTKEVFYNSWSEDNPNAYYPIYKQDASYNIQPQTRYLQSAAYTRLKNVTIGYSLPYTLINKVGIRKLRVYFSGENLWEIKALRGNFDPEVIQSEEGNAGRFGQFYPLQRTLSFGIQLDL